MSDTHAQVLAQLAGEIPRLRRYARYLTRDADAADDLVQDALVRAVANIGTFQPGTNLKAWLLVIAGNAFRNAKRRERKQALGLGAYLAEVDTVALHDADARLALGAVAAALTRLPLKQREILTLIGVQQLSYEEAAAAANIAVGTVKSRLSRARVALQDALLASAQQRAIGVPSAGGA